MRRNGCARKLSQALQAHAAATRIPAVHPIETHSAQHTMCGCTEHATCSSSREERDEREEKREAAQARTTEQLQLGTERACWEVQGEACRAWAPGGRARVGRQQDGRRRVGAGLVPARHRAGCGRSGWAARGVAAEGGSGRMCWPVALEGRTLLWIPAPPLLHSHPPEANTVRRSQVAAGAGAPTECSGTGAAAAASSAQGALNGRSSGRGGGTASSRQDTG